MINFATAYNPVYGVIQWLEDIVDNNLPCECRIDEEGKVKALRTTPNNDDDFLENYYEPKELEEYGSRLREMDVSKVMKFVEAQ